MAYGHKGQNLVLLIQEIMVLRGGSLDCEMAIKEGGGGWEGEPCDQKVVSRMEREGSIRKLRSIFRGRSGGTNLKAEAG